MQPTTLARPFDTAHDRPRLTTGEAISIVGLLWCALELLTYPALFAVGRRTALIAAMDGVARQPVWAVAILVLGVLQLATLVLDVPAWTRRLVCLLAIIWWGFVAGGLGYIDWRSPFVGLCLALAVFLIPRLRWG